MSFTRFGYPIILALSLAASRVSAEQLTLKSSLVRLIEHVELSAQVDGVLKSVEVQEGQRVSRGQPLAQIDDALAAVVHERAQLELEVARMEAEQDVAVRDAEKVLRVAQADWRRAQEAVAKLARSVSESQMDAIQLAADQAELALERARHELQLSRTNMRIKQSAADEARERLERHRIVSPMDGMVAAVEKRVGESVAAGQKVVRVVNDERLRVEGFLETRFYRPGLNGAQAKLRFELPGRLPEQVVGRVTFVNPENDPHNGEIRVWVEFANPQGLFRAGMKPLVTIDVPAANRVALP